MKSVDKLNRVNWSWSSSWPVLRRNIYLGSNTFLLEQQRVPGQIKSKCVQFQALPGSCRERMFKLATLMNPSDSLTWIS